RWTRSARARTCATARWRGAASGRPARTPRRSCGRLGQVPQQGDVPDRPYLREPHAVVQVVREPAGADEPGRVRLADEERRDGEVDLVREPGGEELRVHGAAALDHEPPDAAPG